MRLFSLAFLMLQARDHVPPLGCRLLSQNAQIVEPVAQPWYCCIMRVLHQEAVWLAGSGASGLPFLVDPRFDTRY
jgi:hypothetical protein